jgi:L-ascorbate metabolism protein UlaG (beta-lactamase superfamily)
MTFDRSVGLFLQPMRLAIPYRRILADWLRARFVPAACRAALEQVIVEHGLDPALFDPPAIERGGMAATDRLLTGLYRGNERFGFVIMRHGERAHFSVVEAAEVAVLGELIRQATQRDDGEALREEFRGKVEPGVLDLLCSAAPAPARRWPEATQPGIYRREHASLLIRSRAASVLLDPLCLALGYFPKTLADAPINRSVERLDAVLITHTHDDHWHLPSTLRWANDGALPIVVPQVPTVSILAPEDPAETLRLAGQRVVVEPWGATLTFGDIEIDILPFFGEQPTRTAPGTVPELRNWGNCYRINTPDFSIMALVDSGTDPAGDMEEVMEASLLARGPVDVVASCLQEFPSPFFGGVATECLTLPFWRLCELYQLLQAGRLPSTTAGPAGIMRLCRRARARYFLPYANGFFALGVDNGVDWGGGALESSILATLNRGFASYEIPTRATAWNPGDAVLFSRGELERVPYSG